MLSGQIQEAQWNDVTGHTNGIADGYIGAEFYADPEAMKVGLSRATPCRAFVTGSEKLVFAAHQRR
jgi:hypothetical protein